MANIRIAELDFDEIKQNLKTYLSSQSEFSDYDFEGSGLSVLIDILAYNTHYNAYLSNMLVNEMFLDSAVKRSSAVSIAKHLNYIPRSSRGSTAVVDITVNNPPDNPSTLTLPIFTPFSSSIGSNQNSYIFYNTAPYTISASGSGYIFEDVRLTEGKLFEYSFTVVNPGPSEKYVIPLQNVDTTTLSVTVQTSSVDTTLTNYTLASNLVDIDNTSLVYYLEESPREYYQLYFGDGVLGKQLSAGNIVRVRCLATNGAATNVSSTLNQAFTVGSAIGGTSNVVISTTMNSTGGKDKEDIESIKFNALRPPAQNRLVTKSDYETLISSQFTEIEAVTVWGGEDNDPPIYGKVFISLKPFSGFVVSEFIKDSIRNNLIKNKSILTVSPVFVTPDYTYLNLDISVKYNQSSTYLTDTQIKNNLLTAINTFASNSLQKFEKEFYGTQLDEAMLAVDSSIVSINKKIKLQKRIEPIINFNNTFRGESSIKFNNPLTPGEITSTYFTTVVNGVNYTAYIVDLPDVMPPDSNGTGTLKLYSVGSSSILLGDVGTVNYATGDISLTDLFVTGYPSSAISQQYVIQLTGSLASGISDVGVRRNQILILDDSTSNTAAGRLTGITVNTAPL